MNDGPLGTIPQINIDVFCENSDSANVIDEAAHDRRLARASIRILMGGVQRAVATYEDSTTPDVLIVEVQGNREAVLEQLEQLAEVCDASTHVIVLGRVNDVVLYRELTRQGVSDYLAVPFEAYNIIRSVAEIYASDDGAKPIGRTYAFMGVRGGAGSSTICHNIGSAIAEYFDTATVIADFDLAFGTLALNFDEDTSLNISEVVFDPSRVDKVLLERLLVPHSKKLSLLCAPGNVTRNYDLPERAADAIVDNLRTMVPVTLLDIPNGWSSWQHHSLSSVDEIILVCSPDLGSLRSVKQLMDLFERERPNDKPPRVILNQVAVPKREEILAEEFKAIGADLIGTIPFDAYSFSISANNGKTLIEMDESSKISGDIIRVAAEVIGKRLNEAPQRDSIFDKLLSKVKK